jgi:hypothetical protein
LTHPHVGSLCRRVEVRFLFYYINYYMYSSSRHAINAISSRTLAHANSSFSLLFLFSTRDHHTPANCHCPDPFRYLLISLRRLRFTMLPRKSLSTKTTPKNTQNESNIHPLVVNEYRSTVLRPDLAPTTARELCDSLNAAHTSPPCTSYL